MVLFNSRPVTKFEIAWMPKENKKITPTAASMALTGDKPLTTILYRIRKPKVSNTAIRVKEMSKQNIARDGDIKNRTMDKGKINRIPPRQNKKITLETVRIILEGDTSLTMAFCQVKKLKIRNNTIRTGRMKK